MKRIDKSEILSTDYKAWVESAKGKYHKYDSSGNPHYTDVRMSLFYCQKGLCAYTEEILCDDELITKEKWESGKYIGLVGNEFTYGDVEHFDESIKPIKGWLWDNLFMVQGDINKRVKHTKAVKYILKPDSENYDENKYLQFDYETDTFFAHNNLSIKEKKDVNYMIKILGLNRVVRRKQMIQDLKENFEMGMDIEEPKEYITAFKMTLKSLKELFIK